MLGFALGRKLGGGYAKVLADRVLRPLELKDTFVVVPPALSARRAVGTNDDLAKAAPWTFDALAGAGALVSTAHDQLQLIEVELDAATGSSLPLRHAMKLTQEPQLDRTGNNVSLGWTIDGTGRYWHNGSTGGFHAFVGFDPRAKRGVVLLASTATSVIDRLPDALYQILDNASPPAAKLPTAADLAALAGTYEVGNLKLQILAKGKRLYLESTGEPRRRMAPISDREFWLEGLQTLGVFEKDGDKVARVVFDIGGRALVAQRASAK